MRIRLGALAAAAVFIVGCDNTTTSPRVDQSLVLAFDQAATMDSASFVPRGPMYDGGDARLDQADGWPEGGHQDTA